MYERYDDSEWDDEWENGIVDVGDLRPNREKFGPVPGAIDPRSAQRHPQQSRNQQPRNQQPRNQQPRNRQSRKQAPSRHPNQSESERSISQRPNRQQADRQQVDRQQVHPQQSHGEEPRRSNVPARRSQAPVKSGPAKSNVPARRSQAPAKSGPAKSNKQEAFLRGLANANERSALAQPTTGWRGVLLKASGGAINVGLSPTERFEAELRQKLRRPVVDGRVAIFSRKGGVGKTTISAYLGLTLASERGGRIVALDGDAEAGSLGWLLAPKAPSTLATLASADPIPSDYAELRGYTTTTPEGLEVIVGDPAEMGPISTTGLDAVVAQLSRHYDISIFDTGAGVTRATGRVLVNSARVLLLVMGPSVDSVRAAERTLAWLDERPGEAANVDAQVIAIINGIPSDVKKAHIDRIESHFSDRCSAVVRIPWDQHLASGGTAVSLDRLAKPTRKAFLELAATTVNTLARSSRQSRAGGRRAS